MPGFTDSRLTLKMEKNSPGFFNSYNENTLTYNPDLCINCGMCSNVCPHGVFLPGCGTAFLAAPSSCMECGACAMNCPVQAIKVESGVGCAWAMISAALRGKDMDIGNCGCGGEADSCCSSRKKSSYR